MQLLKDSDQVAQDRTINYSANGDVENIDTVVTEADNAGSDRVIGYYTDGVLQNAAKIIQAANGVSDEMRLIAYGTDGHIENIDTVKTLADGTAQKRNIKFDAQGEVESFNVVDGLATSTAQERHVAYSADPDILKEQIPGIMNIASSVTTNVREITYGANGDLLDAQIETIDNTAETPTQRVRMIHYDADDDKLISKTGPIITTAEEAANAASNRAKINFDANDDNVSKKISDIQTLISGSTGAVNSGLLGTYDLEATTDGVKAGVEAAQKLIADSIKNSDESLIYHLSAVIDDTFDDTWSVFALSPILNPSSPLNTGSPDPTKGRSLKDMYAGIELKVTADESSAKSAAEEASSIVQANLGQNPAELPVSGIKLSEDSFMTEDGTMVYTAQFQVEDSDAVMDIITEIDKAAGTVHRVKIVTEGDGTQIIDEFFGDTQGNGKHTTLTIDAEGNAYTELESIEELQELIERTISFSVNANVSDSQSKLNRLKTTLEGIKNKTITVTTNTKSPSGGVLEGLKDLLNLPKAANGVSNFKGGYALINEEGPELVAGNGLA